MYKRIDKICFFILFTAQRNIVLNQFQRAFEVFAAWGSLQFPAQVNGARDFDLVRAVLNKQRNRGMIALLRLGIYIDQIFKIVAVFGAVQTEQNCGKEARFSYVIVGVKDADVPFTINGKIKVAFPIIGAIVVYAEGIENHWSESSSPLIFAIICLMGPRV